MNRTATATWLTLAAEIHTENPAASWQTKFPDRSVQFFSVSLCCSFLAPPQTGVTSVGLTQVSVQQVGWDRGTTGSTSISQWRRHDFLGREKPKTRQRVDCTLQSLRVQTTLDLHLCRLHPHGLLEYNPRDRTSSVCVSGHLCGVYLDYHTSTFVSSMRTLWSSDLPWGEAWHGA